MATNSELTRSKAAASTTVPLDDSTVIHLTTPMTLEPSTEITITCSSPIKVEWPNGGGHLLYAIAPTKIKALENAMDLSPTEQLGASFERGWNKLPAELKIEILKHNLQVQSAISISKWNCEDRVFLQHLAMGPAISPLAKEVFYKFNRFSIIGFPGALRLPPMPARLLLRRMHLHVAFNSRSWGIIEKFATGDYRLDNLTSIDFTHSAALSIGRGWRQILIDVIARKTVIHFTCNASAFKRAMEKLWRRRASPWTSWSSNFGA